MTKLAGDHVQVLVDGYELTGESPHPHPRHARRIRRDGLQ